MDLSAYLPQCTLPTENLLEVTAHAKYSYYIGAAVRMLYTVLFYLSSPE